MKLHPEDPRLTAFVLGELAPADAAAVEKAVANDPLLRSELAELRGLKTFLAANLQGPLEKLSPSQHDAILRSIPASRGGGRSRFFVRLRDSIQHLLIPAAAAAVLGIATVILMRAPGGLEPTVNKPPPRGGAPRSNNASDKSAAAPAIDGPELPNVRNGPTLASQFPSLDLPVLVGTDGLKRISKSILEDHRKPPKDTVRLEELLNHFSYRLSGTAAIAPRIAPWHPDSRDPGPGTHTATLSTEMIGCPWKPSATLLLISLRANPMADCEVNLTFHAEPANVARYNLLGFASVSGSRNARSSNRLKAGSATSLAIEIQPSGGAGALGTLRWSTDGVAAPSIPLERKPGAEPSDDARFAALVCTYALWLRGEQSGLIDADIVAGLAREIASPGLSADQSGFLELIAASLQR